MVRILALAQQTTASAAQTDYKRGYAHGVDNLNPPSPDDLSDAYWRGYSKGQRDAHASTDYYPDANESRGF